MPKPVDAWESDDDEDALLFADRALPLDEHTDQVRKAANTLAARLNLPDSLTRAIRYAADLHDVGKADAHFQFILSGGRRGGATLLGKSKTSICPSKALTRRLYEESKLPNGFRHELLSLQMAERQSVIELSGLDGSNPLAFLSALGVKRASDILYSGKVALSWNETSLRPTLKCDDASLSIDTLCEDLAGLISTVATQELSRSSYDSPVIKINRHAFQDFATRATAASLGKTDKRDSLCAAFVAAFGSDGIVDKNDHASIAFSRLSHANKQGGKVLLDGFRQLAATHRPSTAVAIQDIHQKPDVRKRQTDDPAPSLAGLIQEALTLGVDVPSTQDSAGNPMSCGRQPTWLGIRMTNLCSLYPGQTL